MSVPGPGSIVRHTWSCGFDERDVVRPFHARMLQIVRESAIATCGRYSREKACERRNLWKNGLKWGIYTNSVVLVGVTSRVRSAEAKRMPLMRSRRSLATIGPDSRSEAALRSQSGVQVRSTILPPPFGLVTNGPLWRFVTALF